MRTHIRQRAYVLLVVFLLLFPFRVYTEVFWTLVTNPIIINREVELFCNTSASSCHYCTRAWYQNGNRDILVFQNLTSDPNKYNIRFSNGGFSLLIKHFQERDINSSLTCVYGPDEYENILTIGNDFEKIPNESDILKSRTLMDGRRLDINIQFLEVHPVPNCSVFLRVYILTTTPLNRALKKSTVNIMTTIFQTGFKNNFKQNRTLTQHLNVTSCNRTSSGMHYNVSFEFSYDGNCRDSGTIIVYCSIGTFNMEAWKTDVSFGCKDSQVLDSNTVVMISISGVSGLFLACLILIIIFRKTQRYRNVLVCCLRKTEDESLMKTKEMQNDTHELVPLLNTENNESNDRPKDKPSGNFFDLPMDDSRNEEDKLILRRRHKRNCFDVPMDDSRNEEDELKLRRRHKRKDEQFKTEATIEYLCELKVPTFISNNMFSIFDWPDIKRYSETEVVSKPTGKLRKRRRPLLDIHDKKNK